MERHAKQYYQQMLLDMMEPLQSHYSPGCARLELGSFAAGYGERIAGMEAFSRALWGLVPYWAGGGEDKSLLPVVLAGLKNGTDPDHAEYWGDLHDKDQRMVEMAAIANGLLLTPDLLWEPLEARERDNLAAWLYQINDYAQAQNNWQFFVTLVNLALKHLGRPWHEGRMQEAIDNYESFYLGNGWYGDGRRPQKDYYVSFAIHYYCLLYAYYEKDADPGRSAVYRERAAAFAQDFVWWFDEEGRALPFGRSLTYRFAQVAFFSVCAMTGVECFSLGTLKGIIGRHLRWWMRQPIFDNGGVLTVGYAYPNLMISEGYNAPGSSYWALKAFAFLALPGDHPFWEAEEEPLPQRPMLKLQPEGQMLVQSKKNEVIAYPAGQYSVIGYAHDAEKYEKFAYSSKFAFSVPRSYARLEEAAPDSMLAFEVNGMIYVRRRCETYQITEQEVRTSWSPLEGIRVETVVRPTESGHLRSHRIQSSLSCRVYDCGFAYPYRPEVTVLETDKTDGPCAIVRDESGYSRISRGKSLRKAGEEAGACEGHGRPMVLAAAPNTNLMFPLTRIPAIAYEIEAGDDVWEMSSVVEAEFSDNASGEVR